MFAAKPELSQRCISGLLTTGPNDENVNNKPSSDMPNRIKPVVSDSQIGNDSNLLIVFYVQIMPDDFVMQLHRF